MAADENILNPNVDEETLSNDESVGDKEKKDSAQTEVVYRDRDKNKYTEGKEQKFNLAFVPLLILSAVKKIFSTIIATLDRIAHYRPNAYLSPVKESKSLPENKGKTAKEVEESAIEKGMTNKPLLKEALSFQQYLENTLKLSQDFDDVKVVPKDYSSITKVLDVEVYKDGKKTTISISPEANGLVKSDQYQKNILKEKGNKDYCTLADAINGAYVEYKHLIQPNHKENSEHIALLLETRLARAFQKKDGIDFMINGVYMDVTKKGNAIVCNPVYKKGTTGIHEVSAGKSVYVRQQDINKDFIEKKFKSIIESSDTLARKQFQASKDFGKDKIIANFFNNYFQNENIKFTPHGIDRGSNTFLIQMANKETNTQNTITISYDGRVTCNTPFKEALENAMLKYADEYGDVNRLSFNNYRHTVNDTIHDIDKNPNKKAVFTEPGQTLTISKNNEKYLINLTQDGSVVCDIQTEKDSVKTAIETAMISITSYRQKRLKDFEKNEDKLFYNIVKSDEDKIFSDVDSVLSEDEVKDSQNKEQQSQEQNSKGDIDERG